MLLCPWVFIHYLILLLTNFCTFILLKLRYYYYHTWAQGGGTLLLLLLLLLRQGIQFYICMVDRAIHVAQLNTTYVLYEACIILNHIDILLRTTTVHAVPAKHIRRILRVTFRVWFIRHSFLSSRRSLVQFSFFVLDNFLSLSYYFIAKKSLVKPTDFELANQRREADTANGSN